MRKDLAAFLVALALAGGAAWLLVVFSAGWWSALGGLIVFSTVFNTITESSAYKGEVEPGEPERNEGGSE